MPIDVVQGFARTDNDTPEPWTRQIATWTTDEKRRLSRCAKDFNMHGDKLLLRCGNPVCPDNRIILHADASVPTGAVLRCGCTDRRFTPSC